VSIDDRSDLLDLIGGVLQRAEQFLGDLHADLFVQTAHIALHHIRAEALLEDGLLIDLGPADIVQNDAGQHNIGVRFGMRLAEPQRKAEGERDVYIVLARPQVGQRGLPNGIVA